MPNEVVDGQDVMIVREATMRAVERARKENTPTLLEVQTYRFMGHSMSDAVSGTYRTKEELDREMKRDPIMVLRREMEAEGEWSDAALTKLEEEIKNIVEDAWQFADASPEPPLEALWEDILVDTTSDTGAGAPVRG
jgi:pyruvate dehydrogenase E1 component alpha subunit